MCKMKLLLKTWRSRGCHFENRKTNQMFSLVKVYLDIHDITNNLSNENGICIKPSFISKVVNITILYSIGKMVEKLLGEHF